MSKTIRFQVALAAVVLMTGAVGFAQDGAATYKAKCLNCHGAAGLADTSIGKVMKMKPVTDASVKSMTEAQMIAATTNGTGKMPPFKGKITDAEIKAATDHFRTFIK